MSQMPPNSLNWTLVDGFVLLGLTEEPSLQRTLFIMFLITYTLNLIGNGFIIVIVLLEPTLRTPMYFFLVNLSFFDICFSSVAVPKMLQDLLTHQKVISVTACLAQMHFFHFLGSSEVLLLTAMSYDRYVAICKPLHYCGIMNRGRCLLFAVGSWCTGFLHSLMHTLFTARLPFCGSNIVNHFFCDIKPLLKLACADTTLNVYLLALVTGSLVMISFFLTLLTYIFISSALLRIRSSAGRLRAFSTCASHLAVVVLLYGTAIFTYVRPITEESLHVDRIAAIFFTVLTPMLNPLIYTLRNQDVQNATKRLFRSLV
ncbi:PREDICTED: olfactory receptor 12D2-like [Nanorana parkeri]|uniref:olfactory receptor 12D2-like n=1 Tax=Nanorana parkeri TaxID=125878 RepID=UPI0008541AF6|nr:PREDICTED: olfactory receptor 12D2-like [Nanorana parkeri]